MGPYETKSFCTRKDTVVCTNGQPTEWEKIFYPWTSNQSQRSKIHKEVKILDIKKANNYACCAFSWELFSSVCLFCPIPICYFWFYH